MGTRTIQLDEDVYERLTAHKRDDESYSEAVERLLGGPSLLELEGIYIEEEVAEIEAALREREAADRERRREKLARRE